MYLREGPIPSLCKDQSLLLLLFQQTGGDEEINRREGPKPDNRELDPSAASAFFHSKELLVKVHILYLLLFKLKYYLSFFFFLMSVTCVFSRKLEEVKNKLEQLQTLLTRVERMRETKPSPRCVGFFKKNN